MRKSTAITVLAGIRFLTCVCIVSANEAGFVTTDKGVQYDTGNGSYIVNSWVQDTDANWYHFNEEGLMQTAWYQDTNGAYYWLDETGKMIHDMTCIIQGKAYTFSSDGTLRGTWQQDGNGWWYLKEDKVSYPVNTWELIDEAWYHFDENGYMQTGWYTDGTQEDAPRYYLKESGQRANNEVLQLDDENLYTFDENGVFTGMNPIKTPAELEMEQLAAQIVSQLVTENMTQREKATAIYKWIQSHIGYIATSDKSDWVAEAIRGLKTRRGDCFTYFSVAWAMLDAAGIENFPVYPKEGYHVHYWNLVNVEGGWYHFDTTPRKSGATFCIVTNAQYDALSSNRYSTKYLENGITYPEMATK